MYSVKVELDRKDICRGCLSTDRQTALIKKYADLFFSLLGDQQQYSDAKLYLCWECRALLKGIQKFQDRIQHAQFILQESLFALGNISLSSLSNLSKIQKDFYDVIIDEDEPKPIQENNLEEEVDNLIKQEIDDVDDSFQDFKAEDDPPEFIDNIVPQIKKESIKKHSIKRYESKARVIKSDIDLSDSKKYWVRVYLNETEIEELLERDNITSSYKKKPYKCEDCNKAYKREVDFKRHITFSHRDQSALKCTMCKVKFTSWPSLEHHWRRHNVHYRCVLCGWLSRRPTAITAHNRRVHSMVYVCNTCDARCRTLREFSNHYKEVHERIICDHCGKSFMKKRTLEKHIKRNHLPATCHTCGRTYAHYHVLENHYRMHHPELIRGDTRTELAYCVECDKQFPTVYKYRRHLATAAKHTPPKPVRIPCPECGKVFARKIRMTNHYRSVHMNNTKHRCDICNKTFCSAYSARTHRQYVHEKIPMPKNKMCDICGRGFSTNRILTNHRRTHTGERPYKCTYCPATFAQRTAMKTHEKTQHKNLVYTAS
ncbi:zinc finger protein 883-like [Achroia grisella]|uniref:zinc finger protein 883-like n=1 Tax=Achroia grisella TaxID=688607 RepID=UPI0027D1FF2E|nr:zinc finger protein 883-like [Achroia grisella]